MTTTNETRIHVTISEDGWGETPSDEDRASFCALVEARIEKMFPGSVCTTEVANVLRTTVAAPVSIDAGELATIVGNDIWEAWCSGERASDDAADVVLVVWGHGASTIDAVRSADSDLAYAVGVTDNRGRRVADVLAQHDDAWCVTLPAGAMSESDLDADPAVIGYAEQTTNG